MLFVTKHIEDIEEGPKTLIHAADEVLGNNSDILAKIDAFINEGVQSAINGSNIQSILINDVGRLCEHYASDLILTFAELQPFIAGECNFENKRWVLGIGIRECGVDHNAFIIRSLIDSREGMFGYVSVNKFYRKIYVLDIQDTVENGGVHRMIYLKNITHHLSKMDESDVC